MNADFAQELKRALCDAHVVRTDGEERWVVTTPLVFDDGDALPVVVVHDDDGWALTDDGMGISHLFFDDFEYTDARHRRMTTVAESMGVQLTEENRLRLALNDRPSPADIGDFLQVLAQIQAVAVMSADDREQTRYVTTVRQRVVERLVGVPNFEVNWSPSGLGGTRARYRADLRLVAGDQTDVVLFAASTSEKAAVAALTVHQFARVDQNLRPVLAYHPKVTSEAVYRFQDEVDDEDAVVQVPPDDITRLLPVPQRHGVELAGWSSSA